MQVKDVAAVRSGFTARGRVESVEVGVLAIQQSDFTSEGFVGVDALLRTEDAVARHILGRIGSWLVPTTLRGS